MLLAFAGILATTQAQIATWLVHPDYDTIELLDCDLLKVTKDGKVGLLNMKGEEILQPNQYDSITAFREKQALLFENGKFSAIVNLQGKKIDVSERNFTISAVTAYFSDGFLLVYDRSNKYNFINTLGEIVLGPYAEAYPFSDGYACVKSYENLQKNEVDTRYEYVKAGLGSISLPNVDKDDVNFLSTFNNGKAIAVVKKVFYEVTADDGSLTMNVLSTEPAVSKKTQIVAPDKLIVPVKVNGDYKVAAKNAMFTFDNLMRLKLMEIVNREPQEFTVEQEIKRMRVSSFSSVKVGDSFGLNYKGKSILPAQFRSVLATSDDMALVSTGKGCGAVTVDTDNNIRFKLNENENIGFIHRSYETDLAVTMPSYIKCSSAVVTSKSEDCEILIETRTERENVEGNTLGYKCKLTIPQNLTDTLSRIDYKFSLKYDGLTSLDYNVNINEWYVKYYEVQLKSTAMTISAKDSVVVEFDLIKTDIARNDEANYYKEVELVSPDYEGGLTLNKITENHFSFRLSDINKEKILFSVKITEVGCPPIEYPFVMTFEKKNRKTNVVINAVQKKTETAPVIFVPE